MTPEERAALVAELEDMYAPVGHEEKIREAATRIESDGRTIAKLTEQRDALAEALSALAEALGRIAKEVCQSRYFYGGQLLSCLEVPGGTRNPCLACSARAALALLDDDGQAEGGDEGAEVGA